MVISPLDVLEFEPVDNATVLRAFLGNAETLEDCRHRAEYVAREMERAAAAQGVELRLVFLEASWRSFEQ